MKQVDEMVMTFNLDRIKAQLRALGVNEHGALRGPLLETCRVDTRLSSKDQRPCGSS